MADPKPIPDWLDKKRIASDHHTCHIVHSHHTLPNSVVKNFQGPYGFRLVPESQGSTNFVMKWDGPMPADKKTLEQKALYLGGFFKPPITGGEKLVAIKFLIDPKSVFPRSQNGDKWVVNNHALINHLKALGFLPQGHQYIGCFQKRTVEDLEHFKIRVQRFFDRRKKKNDTTPMHLAEIINETGGEGIYGTAFKAIAQANGYNVVNYSGHTTAMLVKQPYTQHSLQLNERLANAGVLRLRKVDGGGDSFRGTAVQTGGVLKVNIHTTSDLWEPTKLPATINGIKQMLMYAESHKPNKLVLDLGGDPNIQLKDKDKVVAALRTLGVQFALIPTKDGQTYDLLLSSDPNARFAAGGKVGIPEAEHYVPGNPKPFKVRKGSDVVTGAVVGPAAPAPIVPVAGPAGAPASVQIPVVAVLQSSQKGKSDIAKRPMIVVDGKAMYKSSGDNSGFADVWMPFKGVLPEQVAKQYQQGYIIKPCSFPEGALLPVRTKMGLESDDNYEELIKLIAGGISDASILKNRPLGLFAMLPGGEQAKHLDKEKQKLALELLERFGDKESLVISMRIGEGQLWQNHALKTYIAQLYPDIMKKYPLPIVVTDSSDKLIMKVEDGDKPDVIQANKKRIEQLNARLQSKGAELHGSAKVAGPAPVMPVAGAPAPAGRVGVHRVHRPAAPSSHFDAGLSCADKNISEEKEFGGKACHAAALVHFRVADIKYVSVSELDQFVSGWVEAVRQRTKVPPGLQNFKDNVRAQSLAQQAIPTNHYGRAECLKHAKAYFRVANDAELGAIDIKRRKSFVDGWAAEVLKLPHSLPDGLAALQQAYHDDKIAPRRPGGR